MGHSQSYEWRVLEQLVIHLQGNKPEPDQNALPKHSCKTESKSGCKTIVQSPGRQQGMWGKTAGHRGDRKLGCDCSDNSESTLHQRKTKLTSCHLKTSAGKDDAKRWDPEGIFTKDLTDKCYPKHGIPEALQKINIQQEALHSVKDLRTAKRSWKDICGYSCHTSWGNTNERAVSYPCAPVRTANPRTRSHQTPAWQWNMGQPCIAEKLKQVAWGRLAASCKATPALPGGPVAASFGVDLKRLNG